MLASLRSLLPKSWSTEHEVAWSWLWENTQNFILRTLGKPGAWQKAYVGFISALDEAQKYEFRAAIYVKFFAMNARGESYFKQSNTYLHLIADKILQMVADMFSDPVRMSDDISALGLRHVGYGIPTELFGDFVSACVEILGTVSTDKNLLEGFRWTLGLIAKSLVRVIMEGSTVVMKAINLNTKESISKGLMSAPRGDRFNWALLIQVGTQNISPLSWSIESSSLEAASCLIDDLLTWRADRDRYYFGMDALFNRHWDIVNTLCDDAPALLPELLAGLIWRSRNTIGGFRRVNYYMKHLIIGPDGKFSAALEWIGRSRDPKIVVHPMLVFLADLVWTRIAGPNYFMRKSWFIFTLMLFVLAQSIFEQNDVFELEGRLISIFCLRMFIYLFSLGQLLYNQLSLTIHAYRKGLTMRMFGVPIPKFLENWQDTSSMALVVCLLVMLASEPMFHCMGESEADGSKVLFTESCPKHKDHRVFPYSFFAMVSMFLYYVLIIDMAVLNTRFSAYVLACGRMLSEFGLFLLILFCAIITFACGLSCLDQHIEEFWGLHTGARTLWELTMVLFTEEDVKEMNKEGVVSVFAYAYLITTTLFLANVLVAQLSCSYGATYVDMVGYARLKRIKLIVDTMQLVSEKRWRSFYDSLELDKKIEFNEGDVGLSGGMPSTEPAKENPNTQDTIYRFAGSTSPSLQWPETLENTDADKLESLEKMINQLIQAVADSTKKARRRRGGGSSTGDGSKNESGQDSGVNQEASGGGSDSNE
jgi:hypothetical protein